MFLIIVGTGAMGKMVRACAEEDNTFDKIYMVEPLKNDWPKEKADLIIDFSHHAAIKGIYDISKKYPFLAKDALDYIWFVYIKDQFEEYALDEMLGKYFELHGRTDDAFHAYLDFVDRKAKEYDARFEEDAETLDKYISEYGLDFIKHLKYIVKSQHIPASDIEKALPEKELVDKDRQQLIDISTQTRIFMGACHPISYQMIESLATKEGLDYYPDQPAYLINGTRTIDATFTKQEFLDSIQRRLTGGDTPKQLKK